MQSIHCWHDVIEEHQGWPHECSCVQNEIALGDPHHFIISLLYDNFLEHITNIAVIIYNQNKLIICRRRLFSFLTHHYNIPSCQPTMTTVGMVGWQEGIL